MTERVAVVGMGQMGSGMAGRLKDSGYDVLGYDVSAEQQSRLIASGFQMATSIRDTLADRKLILTSLPDPKAVREAWLGAAGYGRAGNHGLHHLHPECAVAGLPRPPGRLSPGGIPVPNM